jgi:hypothetical protein
VIQKFSFARVTFDGLTIEVIEESRSSAVAKVTTEAQRKFDAQPFVSFASFCSNSSVCHRQLSED